jgi:transcriptional regulator with GAF, ATPase, and Fis domain
MIASGNSRNDPFESSNQIAAASLESIVCTQALRNRPSRSPEYEKENRALAALAHALADSPRTILQTLADKVFEMLNADSAGLSLLTKDEKRFYWAAVAGAWRPHVGADAPRNFGPCGDVLDHNSPMLFAHWERRYPYLSWVMPLADEGLLVPFYVNGKAVGTIWAVAHGNRRKFDAEDLRLLESMSRFASAAYQSVQSIETLKVEVAAREKAETALQELTDGLEIPVRVRTEELEQRNKEVKQLQEQLYKENIVLREEIDKASMFEELVGSSEPLRKVLLQVAKVAPTESTVLITGETGTGKELIARSIHKRSRRFSRAFVSVNCAAIPYSLIASELFGHEKGAFTGAVQRRLGRFELAEGGTIFLDEIGDLPEDSQHTLLRVLQEREFERVGGSGPIHMNVRVIAATNHNLEVAIADGTFRADLFYRLNVFPLEVPALRERRTDIPMLVEYFIHRYAKRAGKKIRGISKETSNLLQSYDWPGNIRELQNVIERAVIVSDSDILSIDEQWLSGRAFRPPAVTSPHTSAPATHEKDIIEAALSESKGRVAGPFGAAARLGVPSSTLESKIKVMKINKRPFKEA